MKKFFVSAAVVAILVGVGRTALSETPAARPAVVAHKVGLIDMARVFKDYKKFETLRDDLKREFEKSQNEGKTQAVQIQKLQEEMKQFEATSPEFLSREKQLTQLATELQAFGKVAQRDLMRKEAEIYKTIYLETQDLVEKYAQHYQYTLIIRFNSEPLDTTNPQKMLQDLNRQVVYHRDEDDITDSILQHLNRQYTRQIQRTATSGAPAQQ